MACPSRKPLNFTGRRVTGSNEPSAGAAQQRIESNREKLVRRNRRRCGLTRQTKRSPLHYRPKRELTKTTGNVMPPAARVRALAKTSRQRRALNISGAFAAT